VSATAIAVPGGDSAIVLDTATSAISNGRIMQALANGTQLLPSAVLTNGGPPLIRPRQKYYCRSAAGKGSGLADV
jgi:LDH2 family malate/lactate/ureidoglycolate dehydrogenase